jgi:Uma2 family endonuclease
MTTITKEKQPAVPTQEELSIDPFLSMAPEIPDPSLLPEEDGIPLEDVWHRVQINLLIDCIKTGKADKPDFFTGGNMFVYYSLQQVKNMDYKGPDFFYVQGVDGSSYRGKWVVWMENGKYPDVIIELLSPTTKNQDLGKKKDLYESTFRTREYYCFDHDQIKVYGWRLEGSKYKEIEPDENGFMESEVLGYKLGVWKGKYLDEDIYLRFFHNDLTLVPTQAEFERNLKELEKQRTEQAIIKAVKRNKLTLEEIAEDFSVSLDYIKRLAINLRVESKE